MTDTGHFNAFHEAVIADLAEALPGVVVEEHFGPFDLAELGTAGARAPFIKVAITGPSATSARATGDREADLVVAAFVVTRSSPQLAAHKAAAALAERIAARLHRKTFGLRFVEPPRDIQIDNHYSTKLREKASAGIALFSVSWQQVVVFGIETAPLPVLVPIAPPPAFDAATMIEGATAVSDQEGVLP